MTELVATICSMCEVKDMVPIMGRDINTVEYDTGYRWCPNCDHGRGDIRKAKSSYDGVGPTRGRGSSV